MFFKADRCYRGGQQHSFQARYDEVPHERAVTINNLSAESFDKFRNLIYYQKYVKDICIWCGKTVEK
jgi:hypothetical protein